jgi:hypothetical protein
MVKPGEWTDGIGYRLLATKTTKKLIIWLESGLYGRESVQELVMELLEWLAATAEAPK